MGWSSHDWLGCPAIAGAAAASASIAPSAKLSVVLRIIRDPPLPLGCFAEPQEMRRHGQTRRTAPGRSYVRERLPDHAATHPCARSTSREIGGSARVTFLVTTSRSSPPWPFPAAAHSRWTGPLSSGSEVGDGAVALGRRRGICAFEIAVHEPGDVGAAAEARLLRGAVELAKTLHVQRDEDLGHAREDRGRAPSARNQSLDARWDREAGGGPTRPRAGLFPSPPPS